MNRKQKIQWLQSVINKATTTALESKLWVCENGMCRAFDDITKEYLDEPERTEAEVEQIIQSASPLVSHHVWKVVDFSEKNNI